MTYALRCEYCRQLNALPESVTRVTVLSCGSCGAPLPDPTKPLPAWYVKEEPFYVAVVSSTSTRSIPEIHRWRA